MIQQAKKADRANTVAVRSFCENARQPDELMLTFGRLVLSIALTVNAQSAPVLAQDTTTMSQHEYNAFIAARKAEARQIRERGLSQFEDQQLQDERVKSAMEDDSLQVGDLIVTPRGTIRFRGRSVEQGNLFEQVR